MKSRIKTLSIFLTQISFIYLKPLSMKSRIKTFLIQNLLSCLAAIWNHYLWKVGLRPFFRVFQQPYRVIWNHYLWKVGLRVVGRKRWCSFQTCRVFPEISGQAKPDRFYPRFWPTTGLRDIRAVALYRVEPLQCNGSTIIRNHYLWKVGFNPSWSLYLSINECIVFEKQFVFLQRVA